MGQRKPEFSWVWWRFNRHTRDNLKRKLGVETVDRISLVHLLERGFRENA